MVAKKFDMEIYIRSASCISPQPTFGAVALPSDIKTFSENKLLSIEPDYKTHLNIPSARRMSRLIKMGVCAALSCVKDSGVNIPDAIICGTGLGCMEDSEKFLASMLDNNEQTLSPTSFIFSTHNTVAAQIALLLQCNNYNFTHTHRGLSFENSLMDAMIFLNDQPQSNVLVGATDEISNASFRILERLGGISKESGSSALYEKQTSGTIAGEGSVFFNLNSINDKNNLAKFIAVETFSNPESEVEIAEKIGTFVDQHKISSGDFILLGNNGDVNGDMIYKSAIKNHFSHNKTGMYKHLCGDYHTSTAFAFWLGTMILKEQRIPQYMSSEKSITFAPERVLILNHYKGREFSLLLLERC